MLRLRARFKICQGAARMVISRTGAERTFRYVSTGSGEIAICSQPWRILKRALTAALLFLLVAAPAHATEAGWALLRDGGHVVLLRHAFTPGTGEPGAFDVEKCSTQRNLSDRGKQQARKMGALFAARAETTDRVLSSRYCNCLETARIAFGDRLVEAFAPLDLLKGGEAADASSLDAVRNEIARLSGSGNLVLVTHLENIRALTGVSPREGEAVIVRADGDKVHVLGRIIFN